MKSNMTAQAAKSLNTQTKVLEATIECLCEYGLKGTTLARISRSAGLSWGAVQHHFPNKESVISAAIKKEFNSMKKRLSKVCLDNNSMSNRISEYIDALWDTYKRPSFKAILELRLSTRPGDEYHKIISELTNDFVRFMHDIWHKNIKQTEDQNKNILMLLELIHSTLRGLSILHSHGSDTKKINETIIMLKKVSQLFFSVL